MSAERSLLPDPAIPAGSAVPLGARLALTGRGTTFLRHAEGPPGAPTLMLLHGWLATGALNWYRCFEPLAEHFNVYSIDHRGHGRGIRANRRFRLADCADDTAAAIELLGIGPVIAVGYSMGGPIAQLLWKRHPQLVNGLVLIATGSEFVPGNRQRYATSALIVAAAGTRVASSATRFPSSVARRALSSDKPRERPNELATWGRQEMSMQSSRVMLEAAHAIANYSSKHWIHTVDVPTSVLVTEDDSAVSPAAQLRLAMAIPGAHVSRVRGGHTSCIHPDFGRKVTDACLDVAHRIDLGYHPLRPRSNGDPA